VTKDSQWAKVSNQPEPAAWKDGKDALPDVWVPAFKAIVTAQGIFRSLLVKEDAFPRNWCADVSIALELILGHNLQATERAKRIRWSQAGWKEGGEEFLNRVLHRFTEKGILEERSEGEYAWWRFTKEGRALATKKEQ